MMVSQEMLDAVIEGANAKVADLESRIRDLEAALNSLWPGLVLDLRYADADDDIDALQSRVDTISEVMAGTGTTAETACELCEGSGETGVNHPDGTQYSTKTPPCPDCLGTGKTDVKS